MTDLSTTFCTSEVFLFDALTDMLLFMQHCILPARPSTFEKRSGSIRGSKKFSIKCKPASTIQLQDRDAQFVGIMVLWSMLGDLPQTLHMSALIGLAC